MQMPDNPAPEDRTYGYDGWSIESVQHDSETGEDEIAWKRDGDSEATRWLRSRSGLTASGIRIEGHGETVWINLPAQVRSVEVIAERANGRVWRSSTYEVSAELVRDDSDRERVRVAVDSVAVRRLGGLDVTSSVLRFPLGELVDWALTRNPVAERSGPHSFLGAGHPARAEAMRVIGRRTPRQRVVSPQAVAAVARSAPPRGLGKALKEAFPHAARSTLHEALRIAREQDPTLHTNRSRRAVSEPRT